MKNINGGLDSPGIFGETPIMGFDGNSTIGGGIAGEIGSGGVVGHAHTGGGFIGNSHSGGGRLGDIPIGGVLSKIPIKN